MARDVSKWLEDLGLGKYAEMFTLNEIDGEILEHVTKEDLINDGLRGWDVTLP